MPDKNSKKPLPKKYIKKSNDIDSYIGHKIREFRGGRKLSQHDLAKMVNNISFVQLQTYENGSSRISASQLCALAIVLKVPVYAFYPPEFYLSEDKNIQPGKEVNILKGGGFF